MMAPTKGLNATPAIWQSHWPCNEPVQIAGDVLFSIRLSSPGRSRPISVVQALGAVAGKSCIACIRQPSQGPTSGNPKFIGASDALVYSLVVRIGHDRKFPTTWTA